MGSGRRSGAPPTILLKSLGCLSAFRKRGDVEFPPLSEKQALEADGPARSGKVAIKGDLAWISIHDLWLGYTRREVKSKRRTLYFRKTAI